MYVRKVATVNKEFLLLSSNYI